MAGPGLAQAALPAPKLSSDSDVATAGYFQLSWKTDAERVELQTSDNAGFLGATTAYHGPDRATVVSGKPNGTWYYRVRALNAGQAGPWSTPVSVRVAHHPLPRALMFLLLGIVIFIATVWMVVRGPERTP